MHLPWRDVALSVDGPTISTSLTRNNTATLRAAVDDIGWFRRTALDIGSAYGYSAITMALAGAQVVTIDPHPRGAETRDVLHANLDAYKVDGHVEVRVGASQEVLPALWSTGRRFDVVFIDGDHSYAAVEHDIIWGLRLLTRGGTMLLHDYGEDSCPDVATVVDRLCGPREVIDTMYVIRPEGPRVSVITPTWGRHSDLLERCVPSVEGQVYRNVEHIIVSDGPDRDLAAKALGVSYREFIELDTHDPEDRWGTNARLAGIAAASGEYIAYLDDDNEFRPDHLRRLVEALEADPGAAFAYSRAEFHHPGGVGHHHVWSDPPVCGSIDTSAIMHRAELLDVATWRYTPGQETIDWDLMERWLAAGTKWVAVPDVTVDYHMR